MILSWIKARLTLIGILGSLTIGFWAGWHWEHSKWQQSLSDQKSQQLEIIHDTKIIHDHTAALPSGDALKQLRKSWQR